MENNINTPAPVDDEGKLFAEIKTALVEQVSKEVSETIKKDFAYKAPRVPAQAKSEEDRGSLGEWLQCVGNTVFNDRRREKAYDMLANKYGQKALTQGTAATAGYLVPQIWSNDIIAFDSYENIVPSRARIFDMPTNSLLIPVKDYSVTPSGGSSAFNSGVSVAVVSEGSAPSGETKPAFKQLSLTAVKVLAFTDVTNELLQNSPQNIEAIVTESFRRTLADWIDYEAINGTDLTALVGHASTIKVPRTTANRNNKYGDYAKMYSRLKPGSLKRAVWIVHPYVLADLMQQESTLGALAWIPQMNVANAPTLTLFGLPVLASQFSPAQGSEGDVMLVDLYDGYALGINKEVTIDASADYKFTSDIVTFRASMRLHGKPTLTAPIKLSDASSTVSTCIVLDDSTS